MSPDELRALADALDKITPVMGLEELHHMETLDRAADYLRACAEAKPVAWLHDVVQDGDEPDEALSFYPDSFPLENVGGFRSIGCNPLYAAPVPPQAEPKREPLSDDEINKLVWKQNLWTDHMIEFSFLAFAREVERAHGIGGSDDAK